MQDISNNIRWFYVFTIVFTAIIALAYYLGISATLYYDDVRPIEKLNSINDFSTALNYIFTEKSGPLGRPISMLTFAAGQFLFPNNINMILVLNIGIHLLNAILVFALVSTLLRLVKTGSQWIEVNDQDVRIVAIFTAALWAVLPIHVATVMVPIQRMAELSTLFILAGVYVYLKGLYLQVNSEQTKGFGYQIASVAIFTPLAVLSKENGALLPVLLLVLELTLLTKIAAISKYRKIRAAIGFSALISILAFLIYTAISTGNDLVGRPFTITERLLVQPFIILNYLSIALLPSVSSINIFHDGFVAPSFFIQLLAVAILLTLLIFSVIKREKYPLLAFAVLWYLATQLLESTSLSLELFYLHRSYTALIGISFVIALVVYNYYKKSTKPTVLASLAALLVYTALLTQTSSTWGKPLYAANTWYQIQPTSERLVEHFGNQLFNKGMLKEASVITFKQAENCESCVASQIRALMFACLLKDKTRVSKYITSARQSAGSTIDTRAAAPQLATILDLVKHNHCQELSFDTLAELNRHFIVNKPNAFHEKLPFIQNMYVIALHQQDKKASLKWIEAAWIEAKLFPIAKEYVSLLADPVQKQKIAIKFCNQPSEHFMLNALHIKQCESLQQMAIKN